VPGGSAYIVAVTTQYRPRVESRARCTTYNTSPGKGAIRIYGVMRSTRDRAKARNAAAAFDVMCGLRAPVPCGQALPPLRRVRHSALRRRQSGDTSAGARGSAKAVWCLLSRACTSFIHRRPWRARARPNPIINRR